jgi:hypothetical protein
MCGEAGGGGGGGERDGSFYSHSLGRTRRAVIINHSNSLPTSNVVLNFVPKDYPQAANVMRLEILEIIGSMGCLTGLQPIYIHQNKKNATQRKGARANQREKSMPVATVSLSTKEVSSAAATGIIISRRGPLRLASNKELSPSGNPAPFGRARL